MSSAPWAVTPTGSPKSDSYVRPPRSWSVRSRTGLVIVSRVNTVVALQQLLELENELAYFYRSTQDTWEYWHSRRDRRQRERRWHVLRPVADDLARIEKISDAMLEYLAAWARLSVGALTACLDIAHAVVRGDDIQSEMVLAAAQAPAPQFAELTTLLAGIDVAAIAEGLSAAERGELLDELRSEALDELTAVAKLYVDRRATTLPAAALEGDVTIGQSVRTIASLATTLCCLLDEAPTS